jgi:preprotein translocase subunit SecG
MAFVLTFIHVVVCLFLIVVVLLQSGKAADLAGAFGGMGSQTTFGPRGSATALSRATTISAAVFMLTSLFLSVMTTRSAGASQSVLPNAKPITKSAPAKPGATPSINITPSDGSPSQSVPLKMPAAPAPGATPQGNAAPQTQAAPPQSNTAPQSKPAPAQPAPAQKK